MTHISDWSGVSVLVTGGAGFIGSNLVDNLVAIGAKVWVLDNLDTGELSNLSNHNLVEHNQYFQKNVLVDWSKDILFVKGSIQDTKLLEKIIPQVDFIFHLAAIASVARCEKNPDEGFSINLESTLEIASIATKNKLKGMCFSSSAALYGNTSDLPIKEETLVSPISKYGDSKAAAEDSLLSNSNNFPAAALRLFNVYGPRQYPHSANAGVISILIDKISSDNEIKLNGDGQQSRDFVFVQDVCNAFMTVGLNLIDEGFDSPCNGQAFNVCTGISNSILRSVNLIEELLEVDAKIMFGPEVEGDIKESLGSSKKIGEITGWEPQFDFIKGLELTSLWQNEV